MALGICSQLSAYPIGHQISSIPPQGYLLNPFLSLCYISHFSWKLPIVPPLLALTDPSHTVSAVGAPPRSPKTDTLIPKRMQVLTDSSSHSHSSLEDYQQLMEPSYLKTAGIPSLPWGVAGPPLSYSSFPRAPHEIKLRSASPWNHINFFPCPIPLPSLKVSSPESTPSVDHLYKNPHLRLCF